RVSAFELLHHPRVPARAAVDQGVELVRALGLARAAGYANAVLRRLSENRAPPPPPSREADPVGHVAALTAHPRWLVESWARWLGIEEAGKLAAANQQQALAVVRVARRRATRDRVQEVLRKSGIESTPGRYSPDALVLAPGAPPALDIEGHEQGMFQAQDEAAQLVSLYAAPPPGAAVLGACAAPGGTADRLAALQASLLTQVSRSVKPGGLLVYAVCTLTREESDEEVERFLAAHPEFHPERPPSGWALPAADADCLDEQGRLRIFSHRTG